MLCNCYITCNSYIVEWEIITNNYITVIWSHTAQNIAVILRQYCNVAAMLQQY